MNKKILIIGGVSIILIIVGIWLYLFLSGKTSNTNGTFANFNDSGNGVVETQQPNDSVGQIVNDTFAEQRLRQLTLRPVAGATFVETGILYVEQGTGHVFHINLDTGNETLVSGTTLRGARSAVFSKDGVYVAITNYIGGIAETIVGSVSVGGSLEGVSLPKDSYEISFDKDDNNILYYLIKNNGGSRGYSYNIESADAVELFNVPLKDIRVIWSGDIYVYTTPTSKQKGYIYKVVNNKLEYVTGGGSLMAFDTSYGLMVTKVGDFGVSAQLVEKNGGVLFGALIPEKCDGGGAFVICAIPETITNNLFPDAWYKGVVLFSDSLWALDMVGGSSIVLSNLLQESGREIDVIKIGSDETGGRLYFINKNDNSLWLFDLTI